MDNLTTCQCEVVYSLNWWILDSELKLSLLFGWCANSKARSGGNTQVLKNCPCDLGLGTTVTTLGGAAKQAIKSVQQLRSAQILCNGNAREIFHCMLSSEL